MEKKVVSGIMLTLLLVSISTLAFNIQPVRASGTIYIGSDYTFTSNIYEPIVVTADNIIIDGDGYTLQGTGSGEGVTLSGRSNVTIKNTNVKSFTDGIYLYSWSSGNIISGNNITNNNGRGIYLYWYSSGNSISGNTITNNYVGIYLHFSSGNSISGNNITNKKIGIYLYSSSGNSISGNNITNNNNHGIYLYSSDNNSISGNTITNIGDGIWLEDSSGNIISGNNITNNNGRGIFLYSWSSGNIISGNNITNNNHGIYLYSWSSGNIISGNTITNNNNHGIYLYDSSRNIISGNNITNNNYGIYLVHSSINKFYHNNFINNTQQVYISPLGCANFWDDGYPSGGNYWSNYAGVDEKSGPDQDQFGSDGIGDTSYIIDDYNIDHYPLISPFPLTTDFHIVVFPSTGTTGQGITMTTNVHVSSITGYDYLVSLSASGQPEGVTIDFNPNTGTPYFTSTMTVQVGDSVPLNIYSITVTGLGSDDTTHSTPYMLIVTETYDLTITTTSGGTTDPTPGIYEYADGAVAVVSAIPDSGYLLDFWVLDGYIEWPTNPISFMMTDNRTLHAVFSCTYDLFIGTMKGGWTYPWPGTYTYTAGSMVYVWAYPNYDWVFDHWVLDYNDVGSTNPIIVTMDQDHTLGPVFLWSPPPSYTLTIYSSPSGVTFTVDSVSRITPWSGTYSESSSVSLEMPETYDGYVWSHWLWDGSTDRFKGVIMDMDYTLTAIFTLETTPPTISILSPENKTYPVEDVPLTFTVSESTSWIGYSLDGQANMTITGNTTLAGLSDGLHSLIVYADDTAGNMGYSDILYFTVDTIPPVERLIETIETWNLPKGIEISLTSKLHDAIHLFNQGNEVGATHKIMDFIDQVEALRSKGKLENWQADHLISEAQRIIDLVKG